MEAAPPSYETATVVNPWDLVAPWLIAADLCSAALVCRSWHAVFTPHLWGHPASHFSRDKDRVYTALTKFQRTLPWARKHVRGFTHTLHCPPGSAEIYYDPPENWLRDALGSLERLQALVVQGLPFFDHGALIALRPRPDPKSSISTTQRSALRLLDASKCENATTTGLLVAFKHFDQLLYLDLSFTYPAKDRQILTQLSNLVGLQVLKLRGISLRDDDIQVLARAIGRRVRSLDLRGNKLTDRSVHYLTEHCFTDYQLDNLNGAHRRYGDQETSLLSLGIDMLRIYQGHVFEKFLRQTLSSTFVPRLAFEDAPSSGITHLYISDNYLSVEGVAGLLRMQRLHVLDALAEARLPNKLMLPNGNFELIYPGAEKLPLTLYKHYGATLTSLKIDHELITKEPPDCRLIQAAQGILDTTGPPTNQQPPLPRRNEKGDSNIATPPRPASPPVYSSIPTSTTLADNSSARSPPSIVITTPETTEISTQTTHLSAEDSRSTSTPMIENPTPHSYPALKSKQQARLQAVDPTTYHPCTTPHLRTLTLVRFPSHSPDRVAVTRLISFISACADESLLSTQLAKADYSLPPDRCSPHHRREAARRLFALETIVLEVAAHDAMTKTKTREGWSGESMTDDPDGVALWRTAERDFSFFSGEEENLYPSIEVKPFGQRGRQVASSTGGSTRSANKGWRSEKGVPKQAGSKDWVDNIAELGQWRREKRAEWETACRRANDAGNAEGHVEVEGYWPGVVRVVRRTGHEEDDGDDDDFTRDYYGNTFDNRGVYR